MSPTGDLLVTLIFLWGRILLSLLRGRARVALAWHKAGSSTPFGVTILLKTSVDIMVVLVMLLRLGSSDPKLGLCGDVLRWLF